MSSFIEAIKQSGTDSLDVIMKNGRVYRYVGIDADHLGYLLETYEEKLSLEESIGRFYIDYIKGIYESIEKASTRRSPLLLLLAWYLLVAT